MKNVARAPRRSSSARMRAIATAPNSPREIVAGLSVWATQTDIASKSKDRQTESSATGGNPTASAVAARPGHPLEQHPSGDLRGAQRHGPLAHPRRQVVVVALEAVARDAELRGERVQLFEGAVDGHVAPPLEAVWHVGVLAQPVDEDGHESLDPSWRVGLSHRDLIRQDGGLRTDTGRTEGMNAGMKLLAAAGAAIVCAAAPAAAQAATTVTVTGDTGSPTPLAAGAAPVAIRNMDVRGTVHVDSGGYSISITDGAGNAAAVTSSCTSGDTTKYVDYHGNGTYTLTLTTFTNLGCTTGAQTFKYQWTVNASVAIGQPATALLTRAANSFSTTTQALDFAGNPGASGYEVKYALGGGVNPDGSVSGPVKDAYVDSTTGKVQLLERTPGTYVMVARARYLGYYSPWSAPIQIHLIAPFDLSSRSFPDSIGPTYQVRGTVGEPSAGGRVTVSAVRGKKGGRFRTLGK